MFSIESMENLRSPKSGPYSGGGTDFGSGTKQLLEENRFTVCLCFFACAKTSHITTLTDRKLYGLTSVIYDALVLTTDTLLAREMSLMSMPRDFFFCHFIHGLYKN